MKNFLALLRPGTRGTAKIPSSIFALSGVRGGDEEVESPQIYLKFGLLISLIQQKLLVYEKGGKPFFKFERGQGNPRQISGFTRNIKSYTDRNLRESVVVTVYTRNVVEKNIY